MGQGCDVLDPKHFDPLNAPHAFNGGFAPAPRPLHLDPHFFNPVLFGFAHRALYGLLGGIGGGFLRPPKAQTPSSCPANHIAHLVCNGDIGVVERGGDVDHAPSDILLDNFLFNTGSFCHALSLLAAHGFLLALAGARVVFGGLSAHGQALAMADTPITPQIYQRLNIHLDFFA